MTIHEVLELADNQFLQVELNTHYVGTNRKLYIKILDHSPTAQAGYEYRMMYSDSGFYQDVVQKAYLWLLATKLGYKLEKINPK